MRFSTKYSRGGPGETKQIFGEGGQCWAGSYNVATDAFTCIFKSPIGQIYQGKILTTAKKLEAFTQGKQYPPQAIRTLGPPDRKPSNDPSQNPNPTYITDEGGTFPESYPGQNHTEAASWQIMSNVEKGNPIRKREFAQKQAISETDSYLNNQSISN